MASSAIFLTVIISVVIASTNGFKIENPQPVRNFKFSGQPGVFSSQTTQSPKFSGQPLVFTSQTTQSSKFLGQPGVFSSQTTQSPKFSSFLNQPIAGYPKVPPPNAYEAGGHEDDLLPPLEDKAFGFTNLRSQSSRRSIEDTKVDPKTGYPLVAQTSWKYAGGNEESIDLPLEDSKEATGQEQEAVDPKTGYPLVAQTGWKDAGGNGEILDLPFEDSEKSLDQGQEAVDPKTGYPLVAQPDWKDAGGNGDILQLPVEDIEEEKVDPKTGYPLVAKPSWKDAGGDGEILELPLEDPSNQDEVPVDPKTGYPLIAQPSWKDAGGDGSFLELPLEDSEGESPQERVDPKTGYPLVAQPSWKDAGGNEEILDLPLEDAKEANEKKVDPKTGYPLVAEPDWKNAGGNEDILQLPLEESNENFVSRLEERSGIDLEEQELTELRPPPVEAFSTFFIASMDPSSFPRSFSQTPLVPNVFSQNQRRSTVETQQPLSFNKDKPVESSYTYTGPENVVVTVTRFLNTDTREGRNYQPDRPNAQSGFIQNGFTQFQNNYTRKQTTTPSTIQNNFSRQFNQNINFQKVNGDGNPLQFGQRLSQQASFQSAKINSSNFNTKSS